MRSTPYGFLAGTAAALAVLAAPSPSDAQSLASQLCTPLTGCVLDLADGCVRVTIPPLALEQPTQVTVTMDGALGASVSGPGVTAGGDAATVGTIAIEPAGLQLDVPALVEVCWSDVDADGRVELGVCADGDSSPCDEDTDCTVGACSRSSLVAEGDLVLRAGGSLVGATGPGSVGATCAAHTPEGESGSLCALAAPDCSSEVPAEQAAAACCDVESNTWGMTACVFGSILVGESEAGLIPSEGLGLEDCHAELMVVSSAALGSGDPEADPLDMPVPEQVCEDGDPTCDVDGDADGQCTFRVGLCLNVSDDRLRDEAGNVKCVPTDVAFAIFEGDQQEVTAMAQALAAVAGPGAEVEGAGEGQAVVRFSPPVVEADVCPQPTEITVAAGQTRRIRTSVAGLAALEAGIASEASPFRTLEDAAASDALCGDANGDGHLSAVDALATLKVAVGVDVEGIVQAVVDVNANGKVQASDALATLNAAVGAGVELVCGAGPLPNDSDFVDLVCHAAG